MDRRVGSYLHRPHSTSTATGVPKGSLFIAETRESYWLPLVIRNARAEFPEWDVYVCAPPPVLTWIAETVPDARCISLDMPPGPAGVGIFNAIMFSPQVWKVFDTEYVLVFQCDTVVAPGAASKIKFGKDFYGAACGTLHPDEFVINGGLSLRRVEAFARACDMLTDEDKALPEDVAFCKVMRAHPETFSLPSVQECMDFAIESMGNPARVVGIHGTDKGYAPPALLSAVLGMPRSLIVDVIMYDGEPIVEQRIRLLDRVVDTFVLVQARYTHSGLRKELVNPPAHPKIAHVILDEFPPMPEDFGLTEPWIRPETREAWWRERYQRDYGKTYLDTLDKKFDIAVFSDADEIPDPSVLADLRRRDVTTPVHLEMAFLVHTPEWHKREGWHKAFVCGLPCPGSPTEIRNSDPAKIIRHAGWHCSSFFDADRQVQKLRHFAHQEYAAQTKDVETIRDRLARGKDPYGRSAAYDAEKTTAYAWLHAV
jgi:beta-1,4-mannosyl-glycoprotein beta-1,4-N-acetylglucosaminyltransferase